MPSFKIDISNYKEKSQDQIIEAVSTLTKVVEEVEIKFVDPKSKYEGRITGEDKYGSWNNYYYSVDQIGEKDLKIKVEH